MKIDWILDTHLPKDRIYLVEANKLFLDRVEEFESAEALNSWYQKHIEDINNGNIKVVERQYSNGRIVIFYTILTYDWKPKPKEPIVEKSSKVLENKVTDIELP